MVPASTTCRRPTIDVRVDDNEVIAGRNDVPSVLVFESDGRPTVAEWTRQRARSGLDERHVPDRAHSCTGAGQSVTIQAGRSQTRTTKGELVTFEIQLSLNGVTVSSLDVRRVQLVDPADGDGAGGRRHVRRRRRYAGLPGRFHTVTGIRGPLLIDGAGGGGSLELPPVVLLPRDTVAPDETNQRVPQGTIFTLSLDRTSVTVNNTDLLPYIQYKGRTFEIIDDVPTALFRLIKTVTPNANGTTTFTFNAPLPDLTGLNIRGWIITNESLNFFVDENEQIDSLTVFNEDAVAAQTSVITATRITGLGMGPDRTIGGRRQPGGITYTGLEELDVRLGKGNDNVTIDSTHAGSDPSRSRPRERHGVRPHDERPHHDPRRRGRRHRGRRRQQHAVRHRPRRLHPRPADVRRRHAATTTSSSTTTRSSPTTSSPSPSTRSAASTWRR